MVQSMGFRVGVGFTIILFLLVGCSSSDKCPQCSEKVDFSEDIFCSNCGMAFSSIKPDGYEENPMENIKTKSIERIHYSPGLDPYLAENLIYDDNELLIEATLFDNEGNRIRQTKYSYNSKNELLCEEVYGENGYLETKTEYVYDENGIVIKETKSNAKGEIVEITEYYYEGIVDNILSEKGYLYEFERYDTIENLEKEGSVFYNLQKQIEFKTEYDTLGVNCQRYIYSEGTLSSLHHAYIDYQKEKVTNTNYWAYTYNNDGTINSETYHEYYMDKNAELYGGELLIFDPSAWQSYIEDDFEMSYSVYEY